MGTFWKCENANFSARPKLLGEVIGANYKDIKNVNTVIDVQVREKRVPCAGNSTSVQRLIDFVSTLHSRN